MISTTKLFIVLILKPKELKKRILIENTIHIKDYDNVSAMEALADSFKHAISRIYEELPHF